ncbi:MAG: response regulator [Candidatus Bathyarchaeia archaeon]
MDKHAKILIVDDDENIRRTMKAILEREGYLVDVAVSGCEAIEKTQMKAYNIAILDIRLPDMEGVELLKLISDGVPRTRKIMMTGYPSMQNAIAALNKNADAYLIKPVEIDSLLTIVKNQIILQDDERAFSEEKVAEFIESRAKEIKINQS